MTVAERAVGGGANVLSDHECPPERMSETLIDRLVGWVTSDVEEDYEVAEYVLERREPDPNPRVRTYDDRVSPEEVETAGGFPTGEYLLQELKDNGMVGETVWHETLTIEE